MNFLKEILLAVILFLLNILVYIICRQVIPSEIIFYQGIFIFALMSLGYMIVVFFLRNSKFLHEKTKSVLSAIVISFLLSYCFHITVPSLLDRSISLYMLSLAKEKPGLTNEDYQKIFYTGFILHNHSIEKRLNEQIVSGNFIDQNSHYSLTKRGELIQKINEFLVKLFNTDRRYIYPSYTESTESNTKF